MLEREVCANARCPSYGKTGKGNMVFNDPYRAKEGATARRFLCKQLKELKVCQVELDALWTFVKKTHFGREASPGVESLGRHCLCRGDILKRTG